MNGVYRTFCFTAYNVAAKNADRPMDFTLQNGTLISVYFTDYNSAANPTLEVGSTGAYPIRYDAGSALMGGNYQTWRTGEAVLFQFDGTYWKMIKDSSITLSGSTLYIEC